MSQATSTDSRAAPGRLRFGLMCSGTRFPAWQAHCIRELLAVPGVELALLIVDPEGELPQPRRGFFARLVSPTAGWKLFQWLFVGNRLESERPVELEELLGAHPRLVCRAERRGRFSQYFTPGDVAAVRAQGLDFVLRFGYSILRGEILAVPRYGIWSFHHGDLERIRGQPPCLWEIFEQEPVTGVTLQRLTDALDAGVVLRTCHFRTVGKSYARNRDAAFLDSTHLPARVCHDLLTGRGAYVDGSASRTSARIRRAPSNREVLLLCVRMARSKLAESLDWLFQHRQWNVGIVESPIEAFLAPSFRPRVHWLPAGQRRRFIADPFGVRRGSTSTILAEEFDQGEQVGRLIAIEWRDGDAPVVRRGILERSGHASYPSLIEHEGQLYCVPEISDSGEIALFRAIEFPRRWEKVATLARGLAALDPSLVLHEGRWWMFYGVAGRRGAVHLCAMHAPALAGPWETHSANPLKTDVRSTRPGGTPFHHQGVLYRPAQDATHGYGWGLTINRVVRLSPTEFEEESASVVRADPTGPYPAGVHTLSSLGDRTLVDGQRVMFVVALFFSRVQEYLDRILPVWL